MTGSPVPCARVVCLKPNAGARLRMFCLPHAGGGTSAFSAWAADVPSAVELYALQLPGRENLLRDPPFTRLAPLVQSLALCLRPYLNVPYSLYGHSMGALIGFELTRQLRRQGDRLPENLFVSAHRAPQLPDPHPQIHRLEDAAFVEQLRRLAGTPETVLQHAELMGLILPMLRADFAVCETYIYTPDAPLTCPISAFVGLEDSKVSVVEAAAWRDQTTSSFTLRTFPGDHFFLSGARLSLLRAIAHDLRFSG